MEASLNILKRNMYTFDQQIMPTTNILYYTQVQCTYQNSCYPWMASTHQVFTPHTIKLVSLSYCTVWKCAISLGVKLTKVWLNPTWLFHWSLTWEASFPSNNIVSKCSTQWRMPQRGTYHSWKFLVDFSSSLFFLNFWLYKERKVGKSNHKGLKP